MKILLISTDWAHNQYRIDNNEYGGVTYYRLIAPTKYIDGHQIDYWGKYLSEKITSDSPQAYADFIRNYDLVVTKHIDNAWGGKLLKLGCQIADVPLVYDLDDNLLMVREDQPAYELEYNKGGTKRLIVATNLSYADALFVSCKPLEKFYKKFFQDVFHIDMPIYVLPNFNDIDEWKYKSETNTDKVVIGYHGSVTHNSDLKMVLPAIDKLLGEYENLSFQILGGVRADKIQDVFEGVKNLDKIEIGGGTEAWDKFPERLMEQKWDIGIAPLIDDEFNRGKTHIKYLEYSMKQIPTLASNVYPYTYNAHEAVLCNEDEWYDKLKTLIDNPELRKEIGEKSYKSVIENQQYKDHCHLWVNAFESVIKTHKQ